MTIAFDAATNGGTSTAVTTKTNAHTCTGANRLIVVGAWQNGSTDLITGVTYAGVSLTKIDVITGTGIAFSSLWYLLNPATGSNNVVVTASSSTTIISRISSFTGVRQTSQPDSSATNSAAAATGITGTLTTIASNCWLVAIFRDDTGNATTANAGTTMRPGTAGSGINQGDSNAARGVGSNSLGLTMNAGTANLGIVVAAFAPIAVTTDDFFAFF